MAELRLPELGEGVHEGELVKWNVKAGDTVKDDQVLAEIMTDKATVELPSSFSGVVQSIEVKEGVTVKVGQLMLTYSESGALKSASQAPAKSQGSPAPSPAQAPMHAAAAAPVSTTGLVSVAASGDVRAAPSARRLARELGIELTQVSGSGPSGQILKEDIENKSKIGSGAGATSGGRPQIATRGPVLSSAQDERIPFKGLRKKISEKMRLSKDKAAHFTYVEECDATELVKLRAQAKALGEASKIKVTYLPIVMKAMVAALRKYPIMNAELDESSQEIVLKKHYNIGISVQTEDGLTAPVIKNVENKSILMIAKEIEDVVARARAKKLTMDDLTGGTITLTNAGSIGGLFATPVINFPEVAILGFNKIFRKPVALTINGVEQIAIRDWTYFSISLDHRIVDGAVAAEFMKTFIGYIENPALLLVDGV